ncbi:Asp23/Gls24 family envelope stress response protein [Clostridia bacterium OttesenSCG-928-O13]|nr:Asp23/Gls24 family envelope stress response protein [Clostridia bacterium OttesenSCG-928-O13]
MNYNNDNWNVWQRNEWIPTDNQTFEMSKKDISQIVGLAARKACGVLGLKPAIGDFFKDDSDWSKGVRVSIAGNDVSVSVRVIAAEGVDIAQTIKDAVEAITQSVENEIGKRPVKVDVDVVETLCADEFERRYGEPVMGCQNPS